MKDRTGIVEAIRHCDLGVIPNHRNTFTTINTPTRIFEYLSLGKPVVAPRTLGIEDYFGEDALLFFEAGDSRDLARKIEFAYFNREETTRFVERGQEVYLANNWSRQKAKLIHSIEELWRTIKRWLRDVISETQTPPAPTVRQLAETGAVEIIACPVSPGSEHSMIGVVAHDAERAVIREFFELFKTPWEFCRPGIAYDVLICSGSRFVR